jgi:prepilin peptidase CpaA
MCGPVVGMLSVAAVIDWRERRIPNWLTFTLITSGIIQSFTAHAMTSPGGSLLGILTGIALTIVMYAIGAVGGGDLKLLAGIGAWFGPQAAFAAFCVEAMVGAVMVLTYAVSQGKTRALFRNSAVIAVNLAHVKDVGVDHVKATGQSCNSIGRRLPYAVPILIAMLILLASSWTPGR